MEVQLSSNKAAKTQLVMAAQEDWLIVSVMMDHQAEHNQHTINNLVMFYQMDKFITLQMCLAQDQKDTFKL